MKWTNLNIEMYLSAKEYIDSAILPLAPFEIGKDVNLQKVTMQSEFLNLLMLELEKELTGRLMLMPTYSYMKTTGLENEIIRLNEWVSEIKEQPFNHIFYVTFDPNWKKHEKDLNGNLIWLPVAQIESTDIKKIRKVIEDQMDQLKELIKVYW